ncbi:hypothetical protein ANCDUO_00982 [Ancylostoma duodenale]|uniref:Protein kinase domain-containing protein n=1 Tax=Ancylostoma duodenale TaxID=51022 RepID=A0A0C2DF95_9BILA|nr:hypothetical protein ANCDUO_00982 [Ancylostoma duodenale]
MDDDDDVVVKKKRTTKVDNWAIGVLLHEMLVGKPPFEYSDQSQTLQAIMHCRLSLAGVMAHPWVVGMANQQHTQQSTHQHTTHHDSYINQYLNV